MIFTQGCTACNVYLPALNYRAKKVLDGFYALLRLSSLYETYPALGKSFREILHNYAMHVGVDHHQSMELMWKEELKWRQYLFAFVRRMDRWFPFECLP